MYLHYCPVPYCLGGEEGGDSQNIVYYQTSLHNTFCHLVYLMMTTLLAIATAGAVYCTTTFGGVSDEWLLWLCIAFGVLFAIMLLINIFLCSAMTCSCTRSEIIEKEPSIYDDYSIYDSQYG